MCSASSLCIRLFSPFSSCTAGIICQTINRVHCALTAANWKANKTLREKNHNLFSWHICTLHSTYECWPVQLPFSRFHTYAQFYRRLLCFHLCRGVSAWPYIFSMVFAFFRLSCKTSLIAHAFQRRFLIFKLKVAVLWLIYPLHLEIFCSSIFFTKRLGFVLILKLSYPYVVDVAFVSLLHTYRVQWKKRKNCVCMIKRCVSYETLSPNVQLLRSLSTANVARKKEQQRRQKNYSKSRFLKVCGFLGSCVAYTTAHYTQYYTNTPHRNRICHMVEWTFANSPVSLTLFGFLLVFIAVILRLLFFFSFFFVSVCCAICFTASCFLQQTFCGLTFAGV